MSDADDRTNAMRRLRHDLRGAFNELSLCAEVLRLETDTDLLLEWLNMIVQAAERCELMVGRIEELAD
jgi:hypothetical protein